jgi:hypothetical protein
MPVGSDVFDTKLFGDTLRAFAVPARNRYHARAFAIEETGNLSSARKAGAYNSNPDSFAVT